MVTGATSLSLVRDELFATMDEAELSLEHFIAERENGSLLQQAVENLQQVRGTLKLIEIGYHRVDMVVKRGEFAIRGGILDVFPTTSEHALRLEFFGDELEDVREFSVADQRSIASQVDHLEIYPARELLITPQVALRAREMAHEFPNLTQMLEKISNGMPVEGMESLAPALGVKLGPITDYLGKDAVVILQDPQKIEQRAIDVPITISATSGQCTLNIGCTNPPPWK